MSTALTEHPRLCERCGEEPREALGALCAGCLQAREPDPNIFPGGLCCQRSVGGRCCEHREEPRPAKVDLQEVEAPLPSAEVINLMEALRASLSPSRHGCELPPRLLPRQGDDLRARCELLIQRWRQSGGAKSYCAIDLEEVLAETARGTSPKAPAWDAREADPSLVGVGAEFREDEPEAPPGPLRELLEALSPLEGEDVTTYPSAWEINTHRGLDGEEWAGKVRTAMAQAAIELERKT